MVSGQAYIWVSRFGKSVTWRFKAACHVVTRACPRAGWYFHPVAGAHNVSRGSETARSSGVVSPLKSVGHPPQGATNPRTGGHRPKKRPLTTGIPEGHFLTWQASSSMPHWCPTCCRRTWYVGWWSTTASMSRCSAEHQNILKTVEVPRVHFVDIETVLIHVVL